MSVRVTLITIISSNALNSIAVTRQMKPPGNNSTKSSYVFYSYVLLMLHLDVLDSLDSWKYDFQKDLNIIDSSNLDYKNAVVNMTVYL